MQRITRINLPKVDSTNTFIHEMLTDEATGNCVSANNLPGMNLVTADAQTAGRGQQGNSWESEQGKNIIFSLLCHPSFVPPARQFLLSQCIALAVQQALSAELQKEADAHYEKVTVKWPNDIYYGNRKISGTLIECDLFGKSIANCIVGTGVNINQTVFLSDAPNPVSLAQITGHKHDREAILTDIVQRFVNLYDRVQSGDDESIRSEYMQCLYRGKGMHLYEDVRGRFMAEVAEVQPTGHLVLRFDNCNTVRYEFKEVKFIIE